MRTLSTELRHTLERSVLQGRKAAEAGARAALASLGVEAGEKPSYLSEEQARLRRGLRAKQRQLGGRFELLVWECAYEQWHRLLFARYLAENGLLRHPVYQAPVTLAECEELAEELGEPDGWSVAARFASEILPGIFRLDDPTVQMRLAAEHRLALEQIVGALPTEVFLADDSLGWVYQYWQSERKDEVNASEVKIGSADLPPVTQLFTENYMVRFLLENSLGAWWAARHPDSPLVKEFEFLRTDADGQPAAGTFDGWPDTVAEVTVMDPCCGSGHFLVEAFGMLWRMRAEEEGLDPVAAQDAVLEDNLFGLELDPRCVQIAMFAVALTAWKQGGGWRSLPTPSIACSGIPAKAPLEEWTALANGDERLERALERLHALFKDADTLGSLIEPRRAAELEEASGQMGLGAVGFDEVAPLLEAATARDTDDPAASVLGAAAVGLSRAAALLSDRHTLVTTNVPYLGAQKMDERLVEYVSQRFPASSQDLATVFLERCLGLTSSVGTAALVTPMSWLFLRYYADLRENLLARYAWDSIAPLGKGAFGAISGHVVQGLLITLSHPVEHDDRVIAVDALESVGPAAKAEKLRAGPVLGLSQSSLREDPDTLLSFDDTGSLKLSNYASSWQGLVTGDTARFIVNFWEVPRQGETWERFVTAPKAQGDYTGRESYVRWERGHGALVRDSGAHNFNPKEVLGRSGVLVAQSSLRTTIYAGEMFNDASSPIIPTRSSDTAALWCYLSSPEFEEKVRRINHKVIVGTGYLVKVPFDAARWRETAAKEFPEGLPEPWSDDPTQWLFQGRPEVATEPLQVAVGRLVGYRWPEQPEADGVDGHADADGIVCLPAVGGEAPAADRLSALLADAYGDEWSTALASRLLDEAGSTKKSLADWLRDDFFKHHCKVFGNRPFVWHIWDGRKDGFAALVNYHRMDGPGLEKLTYTYLGDWIERQLAGTADEVAGADLRLAAALELRGKLEAILEGEPPFDIYVRWKSLAEQPIGWDPDLDDGVRLNIRPFVEAEVLRSRVNVHWRKDRGKNPDGSERRNDLHYTNDQKRQARQEAGTA